MRGHFRSERPTVVFFCILCCSLGLNLCSGVTVEQRTTSHDVHWPAPEKPMFFWSSTGAEEISGSGTSFVNRGEASAVERLVTMFLKAGFTPPQLVRMELFIYFFIHLARTMRVICAFNFRQGVVTPYEGQRAYCVQHMTQHGSLRSQLYQNVVSLRLFHRRAPCQDLS
jgi:regulator of nonsense transcripts 1